jgi:uncharacterized GH25 family protein
MRRRTTLASLVTALLLATPVRAHDYWLEFQPLQPTAGSELDLSLWVGEDFVAESQKPLQKPRTVALRHITNTSDEDLLPVATDGAAPLLRRNLASAGGHLLVVERDAAHITMRARKFNHYLEHEGLHHALSERRQALEHLWPASERYTRHLKAFVQVGNAADGVSMKVLGQRLELVPDRDLATLEPGDRLGVVVLFAGQPLTGLQVEAFVRDGGAARGQKATSDAAGRVEFSVGQSGAWLVRTVHMQRCRGCKDADWESSWAGYSFAVR